MDEFARAFSPSSDMDDDETFAVDDSWIEVEMLRKQYHMELEAQKEAAGSAAGEDKPMIVREKADENWSGSRVRASYNVHCTQHVAVQEPRFGTTLEFHETVISRMFVEVPRYILDGCEKPDDVDCPTPSSHPVPTTPPTPLPVSSHGKRMHTHPPAAGTHEINWSCGEDEEEEDDEEEGNDVRDPDFKNVYKKIDRRSSTRKIQAPVPCAPSSHKHDGECVANSLSKKGVYRTAQGVYSRVSYKPCIKKMLDNAMVDRILNPKDWLSKHNSHTKVSSAISFCRKVIQTA